MNWIVAMKNNLDNNSQKIPKIRGDWQSPKSGKFNIHWQEAKVQDVTSLYLLCLPTDIFYSSSLNFYVSMTADFEPSPRTIAKRELGKILLQNSLRVRSAPRGKMCCYIF